VLERSFEPVARYRGGRGGCFRGNRLDRASGAGWLAFGWVAHVGWDIWLHLDRAQPVVGVWYPLACVGFDLMVGGYLWGVLPHASRAGDR